MGASKAPNEIESRVKFLSLAGSFKATSFITMHSFRVIVFVLLWELLVGASKAANERKLLLMLVPIFVMILDLWGHYLCFLHKFLGIYFPLTGAL